MDEAQLHAARLRLKSACTVISDFRFIPDEDIKKYLSAADIVVLPYRRSYMGPSGILQLAAAAGKPVVASDVHELGCIVRREGIGLVCEPESPHVLAETLSRAAKMRQKLRALVEPQAFRYARANDSRIMAQEIRGTMANYLAET